MLGSCRSCTCNSGCQSSASCSRGPPSHANCSVHLRDCLSREFLAWQASLIEQRCATLFKHWKPTKPRSTLAERGTHYGNAEYTLNGQLSELHLQKRLPTLRELLERAAIAKGEVFKKRTKCVPPRLHTCSRKGTSTSLYSTACYLVSCQQSKARIVP